LVPKATKFGEITQNNGHYAVQGHSKSPISVLIKKPYAIPTCHQSNLLISCTAALKFCFKTCVAMKFVDDDDDAVLKTSVNAFFI